MTRKDYVALAGALAAVKPGEATRVVGDVDAQWADSVWTVADVLQADNPRFDRDRFIKACEGGK